MVAKQFVLVSALVFSSYFLNVGIQNKVSYGKAFVAFGAKLASQQIVLCRKKDLPLSLKCIAFWDLATADLSLSLSPQE